MTGRCVREEPRAQVLATKHAHGGERLRTWLGTVSLGRDDPWVGFVPSPRACRGEGLRETPQNPRFCNPYVGFSQAPERVEGVEKSTRNEEVVLDSWQMTA
jgi:hypothetical protein